MWNILNMLPSMNISFMLPVHMFTSSVVSEIFWLGGTWKDSSVLSASLGALMAFFV